MTENQYAIETISLTKIFPDWWGRSKVIAVEDLNLKIKPNEIYGFLGPNGSGKTTTLKMLLNLLHPTKGAAFVMGGSISNPKISARVGYLPEDSYLYKYLTARETLEFYGRIFGLPNDVRKARIETLLEMVGLAGMGNRPIGTFSKGMARRIGLAQALINDPDLLILDEPTSGMDPMGTRQMKDLFVELVKRGKTILLCSHLLADVEDVCDRIGILYGGKMQIEGTVKELLLQKEETQIRVAKLSEQSLQKMKEIAASEGKTLGIENPMDKLESFFVKIVTHARQQKRRTSGADAGTGISGFLADKPVVREETILDKLVSANIQAEPEAEVSVDVTQTETPRSKPVDADNQLLQKLSQRTVESTPINPAAANNKSSPVKEEKPEVKKDVLNELIGKKDDGQTEITHPEKNQEEE
ncbi:MAG: ABC transporter ATP-binding protein [Phycisphaerae bacterium]|nr:ABC transporter ATP-binding protein [Phycisphaerae bacterium]